MSNYPNKSEAYRTLLNMFRQTYGNAALLCLASVETGEYILTILGTDEKITLKALPVAGIEQGDLVYVNASGDWVRLPHGTLGQPLVTGGADANPSWGTEITLTPKTSSSGPEGTMFYSSDDDHVYVGTE